MEPQFSRGKLMLASFLTLVASGVGFATRTAAGTDWEIEFGIGSAQFGSILGAGFLGFGIMIFFGGVLVEIFGYKRLLVLAFLLHLVSAVMLFAAGPLFAQWQADETSDAVSATTKVYWVLFASAFVFSICQGLYEAVINPLIAQIYPDNKTHYLNILHAGWPAGMIIGGLFAASFIGKDAWITQIPWEWGLSSFAVIVIAYGILALPEYFPATVGQSSLQNFGRVFSCFLSIPFLVLIVLHALVGYMELGVDSWMTKLMENVLPNSVLILVYTSALMFVLRFFAGPIVHKINPIGLLLASSIIACLGLIWLSMPLEGVFILFAAATFYSFGKAFLWPTMLGVAGERYPQSGAIAMGALGAAGMLTVGQVANPRIGAQQGYLMSQELQEAAPDTFARYAADEATSEWFYEYTPIVPERLGAVNKIESDADGDFKDLEPIREAELLAPEVKEMMLANAQQDIPAVQKAYLAGGRGALRLTSQIPLAMTVGFVGLLIYYMAQGGYRALRPDEDEEEETAPGMGESGPAEY